MKSYQSAFLMSNSTYEQCPKPDRPEFAFIGRSNVGKSSLINSLLQKKDLAKTSQTPGKTQLINHFTVQADKTAWYLVDLPGYGYAKVSKSEREKFEKMISQYLTKRPNLVCTFVLIDVRHPPQKIDLEFMEYLGERDVPFFIAFTKADKLSNTQLQASLDNYTKNMLEVWEEMPQYFVTSSMNHAGREDILAAIEGLCKEF